MQSKEPPEPPEDYLQLFTIQVKSMWPQARIMVDEETNELLVFSGLEITEKGIAFIDDDSPPAPFTLIQGGIS